MYKITKLYYI